MQLNHISAGRADSTVLLRKLLIVFAVITIIVVGLLIQKHVSTRQSISAAVIEQATRMAEREILNFFQPITRSALVIKKWSENGVLDTGNHEALNAKFIPVFDKIPQINSVIIATDNSFLYVLERDGKTWKNPPGGQAAQSHAAADRPIAPGQTAWFKGATAQPDDAIFWTEPYPLFPSSEPGITAAIAWRKNSRTKVVAFSILMRSIAKLISDVKISPASKFFLYDGTDTYIDFQQSNAPTPASARPARSFFEAKNIQDPVISSALKMWADQGRPPAPFRFRFENSPWWGLLINVEESRHEIKVGMLIPEEDLVATQKSEKYIFVVIALAIFWAGILFYYRIHTKHLMELSRKDNPARMSDDEIRTVIEGGENDRLEFKSTLRWNLKADKPGKEVELACLKTIAAFLNSDGGALLVGVDDNGNVLGLEADQFANEDKYLLHFSNIFNQHIGLEFAQYIDFAIRALGDKKIFVVFCRKSPAPVFVRNKKEESFFIRSGASSRQLTPSQVLEYLSKRK